MKKLLLILLLSIITINSYSQATIEIYQDIKLAILEDEHGNKPFTPDILTKLCIEENNMIVEFSFEYASLVDSDFYRPSIGIGLINEYDRVKLSLTPNAGFIFHGDKPQLSFGIDGKMMYQYQSKFGFGFLVQATDRNDLLSYTNKTVVVSGFVGIKYNL